MRTITVLLSILIFSLPAFSQKVISGKSSKTKININPVYERGIPPNLYVNMVFADKNNNKILEANETAVLDLKITNKGNGKAQGLVVKVIDDKSDDELNIGDTKKIPYLMPGQSVDISIPISAGFYIKSAEHKLEISVTEHFGYDMDPAFLVLNTMAFLEPELVFSGLDIVDAGAGTGAITEDAQLQPGELVKVKIVVQNIGQNISKNTNYDVYSNDRNIYIDQGKGELGDIAIGEVKEFWITVSPNKRVSISGKLPIYMTLNNFYKRGNIEKMQLPIQLNQKPAEPEIVQVTPDIDRLQKQLARFEYTSNRITANVGNVIDIRQVSPSKTHRLNAVAIVIGIEQYKNFAPAPYAANDANIMKDYFKNILGINKVYTYTDDDVSGFFFDNTFNPEYGELQKAIVKGQTDLFVFYSGHGMPSKDGETVYLFPSDGRMEALDRQGYDLNKFYQNLESLGAKSVTIFLDACFSGVSRTTETYETQNLVAMKGVSIKPKIMQPWQDNPNFTVFSSSGYEETSLGFDLAETGLFTYFVCAGLMGNADTDKNQKITSKELKDYVSKNVKETSIKIHGIQTPQFHGNENVILTEY